MAKTKDDFFTDGVTYTFDHDMLHELVAFPNQAMYTNCLKDGQEVLIDKNKFMAMGCDDQIRMFREEVMVIGLERIYLPKVLRGENPPSLFDVYKWALKRTITRLTKNWASTFMLVNIRELIHPDYESMITAIVKLNDIDRRINKFSGWTPTTINGVNVDSLMRWWNDPSQREWVKNANVDVVHEDIGSLYTEVVLNTRRGENLLKVRFLTNGKSRDWGYAMNEVVEKKKKITIYE